MTVWVLRFLLIFLIPYTLVLFFVYFSQGGLIFPGRLSRGIPYYRITAPGDTELVALKTSTGDRVTALFGPALSPNGRPHPQASIRPTLIYFYGNGSTVKQSLPLFNEFRKLGANVFMPDYVGYGMSTGTASERGCEATADAAYDHLLTRKDVDSKKIVPVGWSLGGAVAIDLASRKPVAGLAAFSAFTSMTDMGRRFFPFLPVSLLLRDRFESETKMRRVTCPVLLGHGDHDLKIPISMMDRLAEASGGPVTTVRIPGAGHNDIFSEKRGRKAFDALRRFLDKIESNHGGTETRRTPAP